MKKIVLVHGLYMPKNIMQLLAHRLKPRGYKVQVFGYNTLQFNKGVEKLNQEVQQGGDVVFVGHSLGGLLIREYFSRYQPNFVDPCIVTLGTPHNGSRVARYIEGKLGRFPFKNTSDVLAKGLDTSSQEPDVGCIVGTMNIGLGNFIKIGDGDGVVEVTEAILPEAKDMIELKLNHTSLIYSQKVVDQIVSFIETRSFLRK
ncbi:MULTISPECIES: alpha/beta hydrolase [Vibrio]|uniref:Acetyltransferase n=2 Tax=Vibrio TaxID=662 RepID=A0A7X4RVL3_9VIBR|nr:MULTISPECIES: alpha/beta hydrolase [Vibrio]MBF9000247.1 acetyltransferase [Vibrio nitrifigilis]MZI94269.1 acetyltransferase [Vibrio eleionomae]